MTTKFAVERELWERAVAAGRAAGLGHRPEPMNVTDGQTVWHVPEGMCGFAWVVIRPARGPLVSYLKRIGVGRTGHGGGWHIWISDYNQSYERKQAHAQAVARVLKEAGVHAYADSRLD